MRKGISRTGLAVLLACGLCGCGLGAVGIAALVSAGVTGVGAGITYYVHNEPSPSATATPAPSAASTPSASPATK